MPSDSQNSGPIRILVSKGKDVYRICRIDDFPPDEDGNRFLKLMFTDVGPLTYMRQVEFQESTGATSNPELQEVVGGAAELTYHYVSGDRHFKVKDPSGQVVYRKHNTVIPLLESSEPVLVCRVRIGSLSTAYKFEKKVDQGDQIIPVEPPCSLRFYYQKSEDEFPAFGDTPKEHHHYFSHRENPDVALTILYLPQEQSEDSGVTIFAD